MKVSILLLGLLLLSTRLVVCEKKDNESPQDSAAAAGDDLADDNNNDASDKIGEVVENDKDAADDKPEEAKPNKDAANKDKAADSNNDDAEDEASQSKQPAAAQDKSAQTATPSAEKGAASTASSDASDKSKGSDLKAQLEQDIEGFLARKDFDTIHKNEPGAYLLQKDKNDQVLVYVSAIVEPATEASPQAPPFPESNISKKFQGSNKEKKKGFVVYGIKNPVVTLTAQLKEPNAYDPVAVFHNFLLLLKNFRTVRQGSGFPSIDENNLLVEQQGYNFNFVNGAVPQVAAQLDSGVPAAKDEKADSDKKGKEQEDKSKENEDKGKEEKDGKDEDKGKGQDNDEEGNKQQDKGADKVSEVFLQQLKSLYAQLVASVSELKRTDNKDIREIADKMRRDKTDSLAKLTPENFKLDELLQEFLMAKEKYAAELEARGIVEDPNAEAPGFWSRYWLVMLLAGVGVLLAAGVAIFLVFGRKEEGPAAAAKRSDHIITID